MTQRSMVIEAVNKVEAGLVSGYAAYWSIYTSPEMRAEWRNRKNDFIAECAAYRTLICA